MSINIDYCLLSMSNTNIRDPVRRHVFRLARRNGRPDLKKCAEAPKIKTVREKRGSQQHNRRFLGFRNLGGWSGPRENARLGAATRKDKSLGGPVVDGNLPGFVLFSTKKVSLPKGETMDEQGMVEVVRRGFF